MATATERNDMEIYEALENMAQYGVPHPTVSHLVDVGTRPYLNYFEKEIMDELVSQGGATCKFFEGAYGAGKSHLLQLLKGLALRKGMIVANTDLSQSLKLEDWRQITMYVLETMETRIGGITYKSLPNILSALQARGQFDVDSLKRKSLAHPGFQNAICWIAQRPHLDLNAWNVLSQFLMGKKVSAAELRSCHLTGVKGPLSQRNAELVLKTILEALYHLGIPGVMLLFDENEKTLTSIGRNPTLKQRLAANLMRRLIDGCTTGVLVGTVAIFAVLPDFLETCSNAYPALGQRLQIIRGDLQKRAWRVPVLPLQQINEIQDQEEFLRQAIEMLLGHAKEFNVDSGLDTELMNKGMKVLENNVGMGYKRELMKVLASTMMSRITQ